MALSDESGIQFILATVGTGAGAALGGAIAGMGTKREVVAYRDSAHAVQGDSMDDIARNYWRDQWRPPYSQELRAEDGHHQFDPDKIW